MMRPEHGWRVIYTGDSLVNHPSYLAFTILWPFLFKSWPERPLASFFCIHSVRDSVTLPLKNFFFAASFFAASAARVFWYCSGEIPSGMYTPLFYNSQGSFQTRFTDIWRQATYCSSLINFVIALLRGRLFANVIEHHSHSRSPGTWVQENLGLVTNENQQPTWDRIIPGAWKWKASAEANKARNRTTTDFMITSQCKYNMSDRDVESVDLLNVQEENW